MSSSNTLQNSDNSEMAVLMELERFVKATCTLEGDGDLFFIAYQKLDWGNCGVTLQDKLQKLQNRAARVLTYSNYDADVNNLFELLGW